MERNLSETKGGVVKNITSHCRWLQKRPLVVERNTLCTGGHIWTPCPDLCICKELPPPVWHVKELVTDVFTKYVEEELNAVPVL